MQTSYKGLQIWLGRKSGHDFRLCNCIKHFIITIANIYLIMQSWSWFSFQTMGKKQENPKLTLARNLIVSPNNSSNTGAKSNKENLRADLMNMSSVKPWAGKCTKPQRKTQELKIWWNETGYELRACLCEEMDSRCWSKQICLYISFRIPPSLWDSFSQK